MRRVVVFGIVVAGLAISMSGSLTACGSKTTPDSGFTNYGGGDDDGGDGSTGNANGGNNNGGTLTGINLGDGSTGTGTTTTTACAGLQCAIKSTCTNSGGTTITGKVLDPSGTNGLYNVLAYVPKYDPANASAIPAGETIEPITGGVNFPSGVTCDNCSYLYTGDPIAIGTTGTDGTFTITNAPSGTNVPVVVQIGKWRTHITVPTVSDCTETKAGNINLPSKADGSDPIVSIPQIAVSMGGSDSLECLLYRLGLDLSEFTSGASSTGHIHVFSGGQNVDTTVPSSAGHLWDSAADLNNYDITLLSCEGTETYNANPALLEQYVNAGGRAFVSHYHYAWLAGPLENGGNNGWNYNATSDWSGTTLANWYNQDPGVNQGTKVGAEISSTLNVGGGPFPKGVAMQQWLSNVGALGQDGVGATEVAVKGPAFDANVPTGNAITQPWATYDANNNETGGYSTAYFSFNTPIDAASQDGGAAPYCGRVVFSGLHVGAAANDTTQTANNSNQVHSVMPSASTCSPSPGNLSPQEKILEFMLFDLSSCVQSDTTAPTVPVTTPPAPIR